MDLVSLLTTTSKETPNPNAWDISKAYYDAGADAWDISKAFYTGRIFNEFSVASQDTSPQGLFFKPDGTKMYVVGNAGIDVNEYTLSTPWLVYSASYVQNFSVSGQDGDPTGLFFKPDGTRMYVCGLDGDDVNEYSLSSAWDISTASYVQNFSVSTQASFVQGLFFKEDGLKMYVVDLASDFVYEYDLSSAWDISTASYLQGFDISPRDTSPCDVFFKPDGLKMYVIGRGQDRIDEYALSSAWDISTASYTTDFSISAQETSPRSLFFHPDGSSVFILGDVSDTVIQYPIGGFSVAAQEISPQSVFFKPDGTKMYVIGISGDDVNEYDLSSAWDVTTASYLQNFSVATEDLTPRGLFFKSDGTKMYVLGDTGDDVNEYDLSSAWDISTASYLQNFSVATQETAPSGLFFKSDGTKMYVTGESGDDVNEYSLSSAWDISTASYVQNFSVSTEETLPSDLFFKPDGTKMYILGQAGDEVNEYSLSSAWDVSSASYVQNFSVVSHESSPTGLFFKPDGTQFWIIGLISDRVLSYLISEE